MAVNTRNSTRVQNGLRPIYPKNPRRYSEESMATRAEYPRGPRTMKSRTPRKRTGRSTTPNGSFLVSYPSSDGNSNAQYLIATPTPRSTATPEPTPKEKAASKRRATRTRNPRSLAKPTHTPKKAANPKKGATRTQALSRIVTPKPPPDQGDWREETSSRFTPPREAKYDNPYGTKRKVPTTKGRGKTPRASATPPLFGAYAPSLPPTRSTNAPPTPRRVLDRPRTVRLSASQPTVSDLFGEHPGEEADSNDMDPEARATNVKTVAKGLKRKVSKADESKRRHWR